SLKLRVRSYRSRLADNHAAADLILFNTTEQETYVVTSFTSVEDLAEHFNSGYSRRQVFSTHTEDFNGVACLNDTAFNTARGNSSTASDREHVFNRHEEVLIDETNRKRDVFVNRLHQFFYLFDPLGFAVQRTECRTADHRDFIAREVVRRQQLANFHFNEVEQLRVVNQVDLVHEHNKRRHTYLTCEQNVFTGLRHGTVSCSNHQDGTVHLSRSGNHVLHVVGVTGTVNVCIVTCVGLIFYVGGVDGDTPFLFFGCIVDRREVTNLSKTLRRQHFRNSSRKRGFPMVHVTNSTNVYVWFRTVKCFFCHI